MDTPLYPHFTGKMDGMAIGLWDGIGTRMNTSSPLYHPCSCTHLTARVDYLEDLVAGIDTVQTGAMLIWVGYQLGTRLYAWCQDQQQGLFFVHLSAPTSSSPDIFQLKAQELALSAF